MGCLPGAVGLPRICAVVVGLALLLRLSLGSGCSSMMLVRLRSGLLGAVCCFASATPVRVRCFLLLPAALSLDSVLPFRVVGLRSWASSPS